VSLHRLLGFDVSVPDPDALATWYGALGLEGTPNDGYAGGDGGGRVGLDEGPFRRLVSIHVGADDDRDLEAIARRLADGGAAVERTDEGTVAVVDPATSVRMRVSAAEPERRGPAVPAPEEANRPGTTVRANRRAPGTEAVARAPRRLGHLVLGTPDLAATRSLLVDGLGFKVSDEIDGIISFLRCSTDHHNVALVSSPVPLLQHYSWECDDLDHVGATATSVLRRDPDGHVWGIGRHFAGSNFYWYLRDPSGAFLELYSDLDQITDDEAWERDGRTEFGLDRIANAWGPEIPLEFIEPADLADLQAGWAARA